MVRKPRFLESGTTSRWMISYMDMLTILLIFFVAVSAQSLHTLQGRSEPAAPKNPEPREILLRAQQRLQLEGLNPKLEPRGLVISLPQAILFASGEDQISPAALPIVSRIAEVLRETPGKVSLAGHADAVPVHNRRFKNNWELSAARGLRLMELLSERYGIPESRLSVSSFGSYSPRNPNDTEDGRASNRRVEIVIQNP